MPCDRLFGTLKREVRRHDRVFSPDQYQTMIEGAKKKEPKFEVREVNNEDILDFKLWWPDHFTKLPGSVENNKIKFGISKYKHFIFNSDTVGMVTTALYIDSCVKFTFKISKRLSEDSK